MATEIETETDGWLPTRRSLLTRLREADDSIGSLVAAYVSMP